MASGPASPHSSATAAKVSARAPPPGPARGKRRCALDAARARPPPRARPRKHRGPWARPARAPRGR
eukprot:15456434-Alexandrium_andersonii.AAC.1